MASTIKIKRSTTTATPTSLQNAELAYTSNGEVLFIGSVVGSNTANVVAIAGKRYPGVLTANQSITTNTSNWVDNLQTAKLIIGAAGTTANITSFSTFANSTQLGDTALGSNNELVSSWAIKNYVNLLSSSLPNTYVAFGVNSLANGGVATFTFDSTTNTLTIGNSTVKSTISQTAIITDTLTVNNTISTGNVTVTGFVNVSSYGTFGGVVNATGVNVGANVSLSNTNLNVGNTTVNASVTSTSISIGNTTINTAISATGIDTDGTLTVAGLSTFANISSGNTTVTGFINVSSYGTFGGTVNATAINVGANVNLTTTSISVGNSSVNTRIEAGNLFLNGTTLVIGNTATNTTITGTSLTSGGLTTVSNNLVVSGSVNATSINVGANVNLTTTSLNIGNSSINTNITSTAVNIGALATVSNNLVVTGSANTGPHNVAGNVSPTVSVTHNLGTPSLLWQNVYSNTIISNYGTINNDLTVSGNLTVSGSLVSVNVSTLSIIDPLIELGSNNNSTDVLDLGFYGNYGSTGTKYTGFFRDATDGVYKLFSELTLEPTTTVDTTNTSYTIATLQSYLSSGALVSNSTTVTVTANSTINVNFTANSITLTTALAATDGGTGYDTYTSGDILVANSGNAFTKLGIGAEGKVLQVTSGALVYGDLDGGTF